MKLIHAFLTILTLFISSLAFGDDAVIAIGKRASDLEQQAAKELQSYLYSITDCLLPIADSCRNEDAFVIGTPTSSKLVKRANLPLSELGNEGFILRTAQEDQHKKIYIAGNTPISVLYGVYSLLEEYGCGFYLGGDALPPKRAFSIPDLDRSENPSFKIRGVLPWYNFFNSPTTWNFEDYAFFVDQLVKTKNNLFTLHSYDLEPFGAYQEDGKYKMGARLLSTAYSTWGTSPISTKEFAYGTGGFFPDEYFGAKPSLLKDETESIRQSQELLAKAFAYAKRRGVKTCMGFEVATVDPVSDSETDVLEKRIKYVLKQYPGLDYLSIWQPEARGLGCQFLPRETKMGAYYKRYWETFAYLQDPRRITEAARVAAYALESYRILRESSSDTRLVISGWGGDQHLLFTDFYEGLDKILPKDVVFSALDSILTPDKVSRVYGNLSEDRECWPIPWFEYDGDQWQPQPNASRFEGLCRDALQKKCDGILGIHWRSRDVEESHAFMSQFAWNPSLTCKDFFSQYAERLFGKDDGPELAGVLMELQAMGYRWVGGQGQWECGHFNWGTPPDSNKMASLEAIKKRLAEIRQHTAATPAQKRQTTRLGHLISTIDWVIDFNKASVTFQNGGEVRTALNKAQDLQKSGKAAESKEIASSAIPKALASGMDKAVNSYARRLATRGELGVLATINTKAVADYIAVIKALAEIAGETVPSVTSTPHFSSDQKDILISPINPNTVWRSGEDMPVNVVTYRDGCQVRACYREIGSNTWNQTAAIRRNDRSFEILLPINTVNSIEYRLLLLGESGNVLQEWPGEGLSQSVNIIPQAKPPKMQKPPKSKKPRVSNLRVLAGEGLSLFLEWDGPLARYEIRRATGEAAFQPIARTTDCWYEDSSIVFGCVYRYSVAPINQGKRGKEVIVTAPESNAAQIALSVTPHLCSARLTWPPAEVGVCGFLIYSASSPEGPWRCLNRERPLVSNGWTPCISKVPVAPGATVYAKVVPLDSRGVESRSSNVVRCASLAGNLESTAISILHDVTQSFRNGSPRLSRRDGLDVVEFQNTDYMAFPDRIAFDASPELTVEVWAKFDSASGSPVFLSHGRFTLHGYFLQIFNGVLRFHIADVGTVDAGQVKLGAWHHIVGTYDGGQITLYLDGESVGVTHVQGAYRPARTPLCLGQYNDYDPVYQTKGSIAEPRLYHVALFPEDVRREYRRLKAIFAQK